MSTGQRHTGDVAEHAAYTPHQLELFYYVATHGGISAASRRMPYGIGQPAISGQMTAFEASLGSKLFERKPFRLTAPGVRLYSHVGPFFDEMPLLWKQLKAGPRNRVTITAEDRLGPNFLTELHKIVGENLPGDTGFDLMVLPRAEMDLFVKEYKADLIIATAEGFAKGSNSRVLAKAPLQLLVSKRSEIETATHFWRQGRVAEPLVCPPGATAAHRVFDQGLKALGVEWPVRYQVSCPSVMLGLVAGGSVVGMGITPVLTRLYPEIRSIYLSNFGPVYVTAKWSKSTKGVDRLIGPLREIAKSFWPAELV